MRVSARSKGTVLLPKARLDAIQIASGAAQSRLTN